MLRKNVIESGMLENFDALRDLIGNLELTDGETADFMVNCIRHYNGNPLLYQGGNEKDKAKFNKTKEVSNVLSSGKTWRLQMDTKSNKASKKRF